MTKASPPHIGLDDNARLAVADTLKTLLADTYAVYIKTHGYHWNVQGINFQSLHVLFEEQYREMWDALDEIAERIRALGVFAPTNGQTLAKTTVIEPAADMPPPANDMVAHLLADHETLIQRARDAIGVAEDSGDVATADLMTVRLQAHEKMAWMLRATAA